MTCAPGEDSYQPGHPSKVIRVEWVAKYPLFHHADSEDVDQTGWMPKLIGVLVGRTGHFVGFVVRRLIFECIRFDVIATWVAAAS